MSEFCEECGVSMDLHDEPESCESAEMKADMLAAFDRMIGNVIWGPR